MKDWIAITALLTAFVVLMIVGGAIVCSTQPKKEFEEKSFEQNVIYDRQMQNPSGYLTEEQRDAIEEGRFDELNEV